MPRKTNKIKPKRTILLIVEGYTEKIYFSQMKVAENNQNISIIPRMAKHSSLSIILDTAIKEKKENIYDDIWCVFDKDVLIANGISEDLHKKIEDAKKNSIQFADSLPAFEIWFLLHYVLPKKYYKNQNELIIDLKKYIKNYCKENDWLYKENLYLKLKALIPNAIANSKKLEQRNAGGQTNESSMCNVYKLIQSVIEEK